VSFLDFSQEVPDLAAYDESSSAWPVLIDEYVEYMEGLAKKDGSKAK
jgi:Cullin binding